MECRGPPQRKHVERPATPGAAVDPADKLEKQATRIKRYLSERDEVRAAAGDLRIVVEIIDDCPLAQFL